MDKTGDPIKPLSMRTVLPALLAVLLFGCSSGPPKQVDDPSSNEFANSSKEGTPKWESPKQDGSNSSGGSSGSDGTKRDDTVPDDYSLTPSDCDALGKHFADVVKSDLMAEIGPKVSEKQRAQTEEAINKNVAKQADAWIDACQKTLAGNIVDRRTLKCAMEARTAVAFKTCLGDDSKTPAGGGTKPKKK